MARHVINDEIWIQFQALLPIPKGRHGKNDRQFIEAVCWGIRTGAPWRDLPVEFGPWKTVYNRYNRWVKLGYLDSIFEFVQKRWGQRMA